MTAVVSQGANSVCSVTFRHDTRVAELRRDGDRIASIAVGNELLWCGTVINAAGARVGRLAARFG